VHHHLIREGTRTRAGLVVESGEPREAMHFCLLIGYGAGAVNPYLAFATMAGMIRDGRLRDIDQDTAVHNFIKAIGKSITKVASKMGISTTQSYRGAQIFEAIGLAKDVIDKYFSWTPSRIGGVGLEAIARETAIRHAHAFKVDVNLDGELDVGGQYQWRRRGEYHMYNPNTIAKLQHSVRSGNFRMFKDYTRLVDEQSRSLATLRSLLKFNSDRPPCHCDEPDRRQEQYRRRRRGSRPLHSRSERRLSPQRD
jgi:glutamate synthase domain-containing protein 2